MSKINLSKIGWKGGRSTSIWIMSLNILFFFGDHPLKLISVPTGLDLNWTETELGKKHVKHGGKGERLQK